MAHRSFPPPRTDPPPTDLAVPGLGDVEPGELPPPLAPVLPWRRLAAERWPLLVAAVAAVAAGWWLLRPAATPVEASLPMASAASTTAPTGGGAVATTAQAPVATSAAQVVVQAAGAVRRPGVYRLVAGARVDDLVRRAGGLAEGADRDRVNLAAAVQDGERVWFPSVGEQESPDVVAGGTPSGSSGAGASPTPSTTTPPGPVDLNTASAEELDALPGVGPATAQAILAYRGQVGRFRSVEDLLEVRGIGDAKLEQLRPLVVVS